MTEARVANVILTSQVIGFSGSIDTPPEKRGKGLRGSFQRIDTAVIHHRFEILNPLLSKTEGKFRHDLIGNPCTRSMRRPSCGHVPRFPCGRALNGARIAVVEVRVHTSNQIARARGYPLIPAAHSRKAITLRKLSQLCRSKELLMRASNIRQFLEPTTVFCVSHVSVEQARTHNARL